MQKILFSLANSAVQPAPGRGHLSPPGRALKAAGCQQLEFLSVGSLFSDPNLYEENGEASQVEFLGLRSGRKV